MKSLFVICLIMVLCGMTLSLVRDYIYNPQAMKWTEAQEYCWKKRYGNLAIIITDEEYKRAMMVLGKNYAWIGLNRTEQHVNTWKWVDGEELNFTKWGLFQPDDYGTGENCGDMSLYGWNDVNCNGNFSTICSRGFTLVKKKSTWDEARKYCRKHYRNLAFVDTGSLLDLLKIETIQAQTASVWTGLRFLDGRWLWVNGMPLGSLVSLPSCPVWPYRCGAYNFNTNTWENRDCNEEINFLCYF